MARPLRLLSFAPLALGALLLSAGAALSACDTAGCEGGALQTEDLVVGTGETAEASSSVTVNYVLELEDGTFVQEAAAAEFDLDGTVEGFREGVAGMRVGGLRQITIPPEMGYGEAGNGPVPSCATLVYEVELLDVQ